MPYLPMPPPLPYVESEGFWEGCRRHELLIQACGDCGAFCHPPSPLCPACQSWKRIWRRVSGQGTVAGFTIVTRAIFPGLPVPYNIVRVELPEQQGLCLLGNLIDCPTEAIAIGMPVQVVFEDVEPNVTMYYFKRAETENSSIP